MEQIKQHKVYSSNIVLRKAADFIISLRPHILGIENMSLDDLLLFALETLQKCPLEWSMALKNEIIRLSETAPLSRIEVPSTIHETKS